MNNHRLNQIETALAGVAPPQQAERLATRSAVGLLAGNGNHCDFFVGILFRASATPEAIRLHYSGSTFHNPITGTQEKIDVAILTNAADLSSKWLPDRFEKLEAWGVSGRDFGTGTVFLVSIMRSYKANDDWRTH